MGTRRLGRECALKALFQMDLGGVASREAIIGACDEAEAPDETRAFVTELVEGVETNSKEIDELLTKSSSNWKLARMAAIDRNILRFAIYELLHCADIPPRVTINEAIEIAKAFGTEDSGAFINGILDQIAKGIDKK